MSARAPEAIHRLWLDVNRGVPRAVLSGIVGDTAHSFGYHLARRDLPSDDYSVQLRRDRLGADDCASALDVSLPPDLMKVCTRRLLDAARAKDPRLKALREFCGTLDGQSTYPWDLSTNTSEGVGSWDDSHLWHIHLSFYRAYADRYDVLAPIADVFAGVQGDADMPLTDTDIQKIAAAVWAKQFTHPDSKATAPASSWLVYGNRFALAASKVKAVAVDAAAVAADIKTRLIQSLGGQS